MKRRVFLKHGAAAVAVAGLPLPGGAQTGTSAMRRIPSTDEVVPAVGLGT